MTERCVNLVKQFEGFYPNPYICPAGLPTVGYGHVITENDKLYYPLSESEAEDLLMKDLIKFENAIKPLIKVDIHPYMLDALISFSFNVGIYSFKASTLRKKLNHKEWLQSADEFLKWVYAGGRKLAGLVKRRYAERELFMEGVGAGILQRT